MFDKDLMAFLPASVVKDEIAKRGNKMTTVTFVKKNGETVTRAGLPKVHNRRVGGDKGPAATPDAVKRAKRAAQSLTDNGNVWFDYPNPDQRLDKKRGFSFNTGRVVSIGSIA